MLPTKLNSADVKGWARGKMRATSKNAVKAAKGSKLSQRLAGTKPPSVPPIGKKQDDDEDEDQDPKDTKDTKGKKAPPFGKDKAKPDPEDDDDEPDDDEDPDAAPDDDEDEPDETGKGLKTAKGKKAPGKDKEPAEDPNATQQKPSGAGKTQAAPPDKDKAKGAPPKAAGGKAAPFSPGKTATTPPGATEPQPNTEPRDPVNLGGPGLPEELMDEMGGDDDDVDDLPEADPILAEVEEKLGDFAETLEDRADEIEELASEVSGDLSADDIDLETKREVQQLIPDDLRQDLVEHLSGMSDEEIEAFCQHLLEINKISDPELVAGFLRAAASDSNGEDDGEDEDEGDDDDETEDDGGESDVESDEDE